MAPRAKGKVERAISYLKGSFLEGREVADLNGLNGQLRKWLAEVADVRAAVNGLLSPPISWLETRRFYFLVARFFVVFLDRHNSSS